MVISPCGCYVPLYMKGQHMVDAFCKECLFKNRRKILGQNPNEMLMLLAWHVHSSYEHILKICIPSFKKEHEITASISFCMLVKQLVLSSYKSRSCMCIKLFSLKDQVPLLSRTFGVYRSWGHASPGRSSGQLL